MFFEFKCIGFGMGFLCPRKTLFDLPTLSLSFKQTVHVKELYVVTHTGRLYTKVAVDIRDRGF